MSERDRRLYCDLSTNLEKAEFFESGRGSETGIVAESIEKDIAKAYRLVADLLEASEQLVGETQAECYCYQGQQDGEEKYTCGACAARAAIEKAKGESHE